MNTLYGIKNCDSVKKAKKWLHENDTEYTFHDYKTQGVPEEKLTKWLSLFDWDIVLNKRGTTYRQLDDDTKASLNQDTAHSVLMQHASMIKRPILSTHSGETHIGFKPDTYQEIFQR